MRCPGSGERSERVHSSGALMCPSCNGAILSSGMTVAHHECKEETVTSQIMERPYSSREHQIAGLLSTQWPFDEMNPEAALGMARFLMDSEAMGDLLGVERL